MSTPTPQHARPQTPDAERRCLHFGVCGGCAAQDQPYAHQLAAKGEAVRTLLGDAWPHPIPVTPSPDVWHYRNKVDLTFARKYYDAPPPPDFDRETVLGFTRRGRWFQPLEIAECRIGPEGLSALLDAVRGWQRASGEQAFDTRTKAGRLKVLLVREGKRTGERMVVLLTGPGVGGLDGFVEAVHSVWPGAAVHHAVSHSHAGAAFAESSTVLAGSAHIEERLRIGEGGETPRELRFRLSPFSFFQTNTRATELLYGHLRARVRAYAPRRLYDLYGGMGSIAFSCADLVDCCESVESVAAASEDGRANAETNGIDNVAFVTAKVKNYLKERELRDMPFEADSLAIVDPPRAGMTPKALRRLVGLAPPVILYVSCKPLVFARDEWPSFAARYALASARVFDLFPHTPHAEVVAELVRRD